jgi:hypothetical protein
MKVSPLPRLLLSHVLLFRNFHMGPKVAINVGVKSSFSREGKKKEGKFN